MSWRKVGSLGPQSRRCFASLPAKARLESQLPKISAVDNGFIVGSIENYAPVSHVIVAVGAGPRHEKAHEKGVSHAIRTLSNIGTSDASKFAISRVLVSWAELDFQDFDFVSSQGLTKLDFHGCYSSRMLVARIS